MVYPDTFTEQIELKLIVCCSCGVPFGMETSFRKTRYKDGKNFYCPNGHAQCYGKSEADELRDRLKQEKANTEWWKSEAESKARSLNATRGVVTRLKKQVIEGRCPCCKRTYKALARHMAKMHPDFENRDEEAIG